MLHLVVTLFISVVAVAAQQKPTEPCAQLSALQAAAAKSKTSTHLNGQISVQLIANDVKLALMMLSWA